MLNCVYLQGFQRVTADLPSRPVYLGILPLALMAFGAWQELALRPVGAGEGKASGFILSQVPSLL
jgi:hypothetical protein